MFDQHSPLIPGFALPIHPTCPSFEAQNGPSTTTRANHTGSTPRPGSRPWPTPSGMSWQAQMGIHAGGTPNLPIPVMPILSSPSPGFAFLDPIRHPRYRSSPLHLHCRHTETGETTRASPFWVEKEQVPFPPPSYRAVTILHSPPCFFGAHSPV